MNNNPIGWPGRGLQLVARLFSSGVNATTPVTAISEAPIGATDIDLALVTKGAGALLAQVPDGTAAGGNKRGARAVDLQRSRSSAASVASGTNSAVLSGSDNIASNTHATVCGGLGNSATGVYSFAGGGNANTALSSFAGVASGQSNVASGIYSFIGGGSNNTANAGGSAILGGYYGTTRSIEGYHVFPACVQPISGSAGVTQSARLLLARQTTNDTATVLASDANAIAATNQVTLPNNSAYSFSGEVIATITGGGDTARWTINGAIKRGATAATTAMVGTPTVTMTHNNAGAAAWVVAITANTTLGCLTVTVTGAAATTIRWVAKIDTTEVTF